METKHDRHFDASILASDYHDLITSLESKLKNTIVSPTQSKHNKIWKDRNISNNPIILSLVEVLEQSLEPKDNLAPFWNNNFQEISRKLYFPSQSDNASFILKRTNNTAMGSSWFTIQSNKTNIPESLLQGKKYVIQNHLGEESFECKGKSRARPKLHNPTGLKSLKIRLFPSAQQKEELKLYFEQFRWYYNAALSILNKDYTQDQILETKWTGNNDFRVSVLSHEYRESSNSDGTILKEFIKGTKDTKLKHQGWTKVHCRIPRGAICKLSYALDSAISKLRNRSISKFEMHPLTKKDASHFIHFGDSSFPRSLLQIRSSYWIRTKDHKRSCFSFKDIFQSTKQRGLEVLYDELLDRYTLVYPVDYSWFPENDLRTEKQSKYAIPGNKRVISLDPGLRKFLVGYDPSGKVSIIGEGAQNEIIRLLVKLDKENLSKQESHMLWNRINCLVSEMHWKTINYLISNYDVILYPNFEISKMVSGKKLSYLSKLIMYMFSFYKFKSKLEWKCQKHGKTLIIVDESYTSKTCGSCGHLNTKLGSSETFTCESCNLNIDRDYNGARNILLKNMRLR